MRMTRHPLPPLRALRAFEAAARHLSFTMAAAELGVTPGAISHQIKTLEDWVGAPLFIRLTRSLRLTQVGEAALPELTSGFDQIAQGVAELRKAPDDRSLTISVSPGFGSLWLVPRLERFRARHPDIELRIDGTDRLVDIGRGQADLGIRYGLGGYTGVSCDRLFGMCVAPVCSPELLRREPRLTSPSDLAHHTLLHVDWKEEEGSWRHWLRAAGAKGVDPSSGPRFTKEEMAVRAALDGEGVALLGDRMAADHLATGRLIHPFPAELNTALTFAYFLLAPQDRIATPKVAAFRTWLLDEARGA